MQDAGLTAGDRSGVQAGFDAAAAGFNTNDFNAEVIEERMETRNIEDLGGVAYKAPVFALFFAVAMLASVGLPGTSGFIGEFLIILGAVKFNVTRLSQPSTVLINVW